MFVCDKLVSLKNTVEHSYVFSVNCDACGRRTSGLRVALVQAGQIGP